jgi:hypothetical protein
MIGLRPQFLPAVFGLNPTFSSFWPPHLRAAAYSQNFPKHPYILSGIFIQKVFHFWNSYPQKPEACGT